MTDLKFAILKFIYDSPYHECGEVELFNQRLANPITVQQALDDMAKTVHDYTTNQDYPPMIIRKPIGTGILKLTSSGNTTYETAKEERADKSEQKRQQSFNNKISVASVFVPLITFVLGLVVESCAHIIDWISALFK